MIKVLAICLYFCLPTIDLYRILFGFVMAHSLGYAISDKINIYPVTPDIQKYILF